MTPFAGKHIGPYEIVGPLGAGGMGEVYRALDARLGRQVAVKMLPAAVFKDGEWLRRFEQEARAAGSLNHPNILTIFDVGSHEGAPYIVSELLEGTTLGDELKNGPLPVRKAVEYATQLAHGLAAAHEKGIFHRDLKPDNVFVTTDGRIKILDFGLAKQSDAVSDPARSSLPTAAVTEPGVVLGTVGYMSPEQVLGLPADHRSDIFSFGSVLYEMLSGRRAFFRDSTVETMNAILKEDPPEIANDINRTLPPTLDSVVRHCLEKKPEHRFQSARDLAFAVNALSVGSSASSTVTPMAGITASKPKGRSIVAATLLVTLGALVSAGIQSFREQPQTAWSGVLLGGPDVAVGPRTSPDGKTLAFLALVNNLTQVAIMDPSNGNWTVLTQDRSHGPITNLAWAIDGSRIYFDRNFGGIWNVLSVPALGGEERLVVEDSALPLPLRDGSLIVLRLNDRRSWELHHFWPESGRSEVLGAILDAPFWPARVSGDGKELAWFGWLGEQSSNTIAQFFAGDIVSKKFAPIASAATAVNGSGLAPDRQQPGWFTQQMAGDLFQIVRMSSAGGGRRTLMELTHQVWGMDSDLDGSLYLDQWDRPREVIRFTLTGGDPERLASSRVDYTREYSTVLADGRVLFETQFSGRSRLAVVRPGERVFPLVETSEETFAIAAVISDEEIACVIGRAPNQTVAVVSTKNGRIIRRLKATEGKRITSLAASPDGKTLYFVESQTIWAIPVMDGQPRRLASGGRIAASPDGLYLVSQEIEKEGVRLVRIDLNRGEAQPIWLNLGNLRLSAGALAPNSVAADGRIVIEVDSPDSSFQSAAIVDPRTGRVDKAPINFSGDIHSPGWTKDGRIVAAGLPMRSSLWRFRPVHLN